MAMSSRLSLLLPGLVRGSNEPQPGIVDERCGLEGLSGFHIGHPGESEFAQLLIDEREQLIGGVLGSTFLTLVLLPVLYQWAEAKAPKPVDPSEI